MGLEDRKMHFEMWDRGLDAMMRAMELRGFKKKNSTEYQRSS